MAPKRSKSLKDERRNNESKSKQKNCTEPDGESAEKDLLLDDVTCQICWNIFIEPVRLPCDHVLCNPCFASCLEKANLECPMCRKRFSNWCRQATKNKSLIDEKLWTRIQKQFPDKVAEAQSRTEQDDVDNCRLAIQTNVLFLCN